MRPIWSGFISFALVHIPVELYAAEHRADIRFHLLDSRDKSRIRYHRLNEKTGEEVPWNRTARAYEYSKDHYVVVKDEELKKISTATKIIAIEHFVTEKEIDYPYFERPYYLIPEKSAAKGYVLLRDTLLRTQKVGIAKIVIHGREHLSAIIATPDGLMLELLRFEQELRPITEFDIPSPTAKELKISAKEQEAAKQLINSMTQKWHPEQYHDEYRESLMKWIASKAKGKKPREEVVTFKTKTEPVDLFSLMQKSIKSLKNPEKNNIIPLKRKKRNR